MVGVWFWGSDAIGDAESRVLRGGKKTLLSKALKGVGAGLAEFDACGWLDGVRAGG